MSERIYHRVISRMRTPAVIDRALSDVDDFRRGIRLFERLDLLVGDAKMLYPKSFEHREIVKRGKILQGVNVGNVDVYKLLTFCKRRKVGKLIAPEKLDIVKVL